ncbi:hypothetical protein RJ641_034340 [Dillenia turbinata]|uniref:Replication factor A C-terminal domain-containing protein n=1 Tax=Dillenia turbinata TaxID=194707 RepID=A0AAN8ZH72_9MAGN
MGKTYWIKAIPTIVDINQTFYYSVCEHCGKGGGAPIGILYDCHQCTTKNIKAVPKAKFTIQLAVNSGFLTEYVQDKVNQYLLKPSTLLITNYLISKYDLLLLVSEASQESIMQLLGL